MLVRRSDRDTRVEESRIGAAIIVPEDLINGPGAASSRLRLGVSSGRPRSGSLQFGAQFHEDFRESLSIAVHQRIG